MSTKDKESFWTSLKREVRRSLESQGILKRRPRPRPPQETIADPLFGKMQWDELSCAWACTPRVTFRGRDLSIDLIIYVSEEHLEVCEAQRKTWQRFVRDTDGHVTWAVSEMWNADGHTWCDPSVNVSDLLHEATVTSGSVGPDGRLEIDIDVGEDLGGHGITLQLGPSEAERGIAVEG